MATKDYEIGKNDRILAMITFRGNVISQINTGSFDSFSELLSTLKSKATSMPGLSQLFVRNFSRGWHLQSPLYLR